MNPTKHRGCSGMVISSGSQCGTNRVTIVSNPVISHEYGKGRIVITTEGTYSLSFVTQMFRNG